MENNEFKLLDLIGKMVLIFMIVKKINFMNLTTKDLKSKKFK